VFRGQICLGSTGVNVSTIDIAFSLRFQKAAYASDMLTNIKQTKNQSIAQICCFDTKPDKLVALHDKDKNNIFPDHATVL